MVNTKAMLTVKHDAAGTFADYSKEAADFQRDNFICALAATASHYLYVGFDKPFKAFYAELSTKSVAASVLSAAYYNEVTASWVNVAISDDTKAFTRSGFVQISGETTDWGKTTINTVEKYYLRLTVSVALTAGTAFSGINIVYSDDNDLKEEFYGIDRLLPTSATSFILAHVASRNQIIQELSNKGKLKYDETNGWQGLTPFDLLDIYEIRLASTFLTIAKILFDASDDPEGNLIKKAQRYENMYSSMLQSMSATIDADNNGVVTEDEKVNKVTCRRIIR